MWAVTNKFDDVRKFWDGDKGCDVLVSPGATVHTMRPPEESDVWKVAEVDAEAIEEVKNKKGGRTR